MAGLDGKGEGQVGWMYVHVPAYSHLNSLSWELAAGGWESLELRELSCKLS